MSERFNPNFADLTSISKTLRENAALAIQPAEVGSFVIPATLPTRAKSLDPDAVLMRYSELLSAVDHPAQALSASIGALQVCRELGRLLRRDIETIEVTTYNREHTPQPTLEFNTEFVVRIDRLLERRRITAREVERLTGRLEALDIRKNTFQLKLPKRTRRVVGTCFMFSVSLLREQLGATITVEGEVIREGRNVTLNAHAVVSIDDA